MISFILPTRDRRERLERTLASIGALPGLGDAVAEVIVADNASRVPARLPERLANGVTVEVVQLDHNASTAARNVAADRAAGSWLLMLDDDSYPLDDGFLEVLAEAPPDVAAIGAEILLPGGSHEAGGLPEVVVGCGAAIRHDAFTTAGGYDGTFGYYAEEYDLCAKLLAGGHRVIHDLRFRVRHEKVEAGRDMDRIVKHLVRNNGWVMQRYAPDDAFGEQLQETIERYGRIAEAEGADKGYSVGLAELLETLDGQPRSPLTPDVFDRFTGLAHARAGVAAAVERGALGSGMTVGLTAAGKNAWAVRRALDESGLDVQDDEHNADVLVVATLSPGPVLDAEQRWESGALPLIVPWSPGVPLTAARP